MKVLNSFPGDEELSEGRFEILNISEFLHCLLLRSSTNHLFLRDDNYRHTV